VLALNPRRIRLLEVLAGLDLTCSAGISLLRYRGAIAPESFSAFVNLHLLFLVSLAIVMLLRAGAERSFLVLVAGLLLGEIGFAYAEFTGLHQGRVALAAEYLWVLVRIGILLQSLAWARAGTAEPAQQRRWGLAASIVVVPAGLAGAVLPLTDAGNPLSALVAALAILALIAIAWAWPALSSTLNEAQRWALAGLGVYLATELLRYGLEGFGAGNLHILEGFGADTWLALFEVGYFAGYLALIRSAMAPWQLAEQH